MRYGLYGARITGLRCAVPELVRERAVCVMPSLCLLLTSTSICNTIPLCSVLSCLIHHLFILFFFIYQPIIISFQSTHLSLNNCIFGESILIPIIYLHGFRLNGFRLNTVPSILSTRLLPTFSTLFDTYMTPLLLYLRKSLIEPLPSVNSCLVRGEQRPFFGTLLPYFCSFFPSFYSFYILFYLDVSSYDLFYCRIKRII